MSAQPNPVASPGPLQRMASITLLALGGACLAYSAIRHRISRGMKRVIAGDESFSAERLRHSILGQSKQTIMTRLGPPHAVVNGQSIASGSNAPSYFTSDTWYYLLEEAAQSAIAVEFDAEAARAVEFLAAPSSMSNR